MPAGIVLICCFHTIKATPALKFLMIMFPVIINLFCDEAEHHYQNGGGEKSLV
jgi:hypothetical protein